MQTAGAPAVWEVASIEPGLDLEPGAPADWAPAATVGTGGVPWGRLPHPFVFRALGTIARARAGRVTGDVAGEPLAGGTELSSR